ncbi:hypothetical protein [Tetragenococcus halophilus]|uniref:hypothetical protein n=1 Tax=Tetragenococcus halophilus TaxID=51669 RepID=UPI00209AF1B7|nr:hypothetical protein [Tetragenococcus halophilus]MCO8286669.1 hypothetical protein [Tetragenococcus halophilus]MCO8292642.1 hypothetical protein [Tetragenococcus halophilus]
MDNNKYGDLFNLGKTIKRIVDESKPKFEKTFINIEGFRKRLNEYPFRFAIMDKLTSETMLGETWKNLIETAKRIVYFDDKADYQQLDYLANQGWGEITFVYPVTHLYSITGYSEKELNKHMIRLYCRNDMYYLFDTLNTIAEIVDEDYKRIVYQMMDVLREDWRYYKICVSNLFILIEHFSLKKRSPNMDEKRNFNGKMLRRIIVENEDEELFTLMEKQCKRLIDNYWIKQKFTKPNDLYLGRHTYLHGRFSPEKVSFADFLRLVNNVALYFQVIE